MDKTKENLKRNKQNERKLSYMGLGLWLEQRRRSHREWKKSIPFSSFPFICYPKMFSFSIWWYMWWSSRLFHLQIQQCWLQFIITELFILCFISPFLFTSTITNFGVNSNTSAAIVNGPFTPSRDPSKLTLQSFFLTVKLTNFAISSNFDIIFDTGALDTNLASSPPSSNNPERSNPGENEIISNAFKLAGLGSEVTFLLVSIISESDSDCDWSDKESTSSLPSSTLQTLSSSM